jgi:hypothetical protein
MNAVTYQESAALHTQQLTFFSESLGTEVRVSYELDTEPMHYQVGTILVGLDLLDVWIGNWDAGLHLSSTSLNCIHAELCAEVLS